jgi:hypothetical protein
MDGKMIKHDVQIEKVDLSELKVAHDKGDGKFKLDIPRYQRGIVWTKKQKEALLESISLGYPVGSLLAFQTNKKNDKGSAPVVWELVDGLQRASTLIEYMENPFAVAGINSFIDSDDIKNLAERIYQNPTHLQVEGVQRLIEDWLKMVKKPTAEAGFTNAQLLIHLKKEITDSEVISNHAHDLLLVEFLGNGILTKIFDKVNLIQSSQLPIIVYTGSAENVPDIFERINSQGIKLSKYETFAATWNTVGTVIVNQEIKDAIDAKYEELTKAGYTVSGIDSLKNGTGQYNLFEYLFGLGKLLSDKFEYLFPESSKPDELVSSAFVLATTAYQLKTSQMSKLAHTLVSLNNGGTIDISSFESALISSCEDIQKKLQKYMKIGLNSTPDSKRFLPHSENQIYSLIIRYMVEKYDHEHNWALRAKSESAKILENIPLYYLLDVLNGEWAGSGDTRLWNLVWQVEDDDSLTRSLHYLVTPTYQTWEDALNNWHNKELSKLQFKRTNISSDSKMFLKYLYSDIVTVADDESLTFHIEHLWSVKALTDLIQASPSKEGWPISGIGNLSILTNSVNTKKGEKMLGDYKAETGFKEVTEFQWQRIQEWLINPEVEELKYRPNFTKHDFLDFCTSRFEVIKKQLLVQLGYE